MQKKSKGASGRNFRLSRKQIGILAAVFLIISLSLFWFITGQEDGSKEKQTAENTQETTASDDQDKKNDTNTEKEKQPSKQEQSISASGQAIQASQTVQGGEVQGVSATGNRHSSLSESGNTPAWKNQGSLRTEGNAEVLPGVSGSLPEFLGTIEDNPATVPSETVSGESPEDKPEPTKQPGGMEQEDNYHTIRFESNGGGSLSDLKLKDNTVVSELPIPNKRDCIFLGWFKDQECQERWADGSRIQGDMTLYAAYTESEKLEETDGNVFVTKLDQNTDFTIGIQAAESMSAAQVREGIHFEAVSEGTHSQTELLVEGGSGSFQVSGKGGFQEGSTYQLTLEDENLSFAGEPENASIYSFTIKKDDVQNLSLDEDLIYIPADSVTEMKKDGEKVSKLSVPLAEADINTGTAAVQYSRGSFTYKESELSIGDTVAIYEGQRPDLREINSDSGQGSVAYVTITEKNKDTYCFETAEVEEVLFIPDVLPVPEEYYDEDMQFVIEEEYFDFSGNEYEGTGLDEETEVEEGDFLAFYSENNDTVLWYGKIREVENVDGSYDITFEPMDLEEIQASMDLYDSRDIDSSQILSDDEIAELESSIEQQAFASGFVDEAASYLAGMALETEEVKRQMGPELFANRAGSRVSIENTWIKANISRNLQHFQGKSGVRCALQVTCTVKVKCSNGAELRMKLTGTFTEEVRLAINVSSNTIWKWKWIFPYIYDYKLNTNLDVYNFTAIDIQAAVASKSPSQKWGDPGTQEYYDIAKDIKKLMDAGKYQSEAIEGGVQKMTDRYHAMLQQESDWVTLFDQKMFSTKGAVDPFHILAYGVDCSFVTSANLNLSLGCAFEYEIGRRYCYVVELFHKKATSNTINLVDERYELEFYVMGTLGLRAGIRLEVELGLFSTALDSVGISAEVGAYVRMWGYFYYHLAHTGRGGTVSQSSGALLTELGTYLDISFKAQAFNGIFQHEEKLYNREWPLWSAGVRQNVYGFADTRVPVVDIRRSVKTYRLSDDIFKMNRMDLKTGKTSVSQYDDRSDFIISFTNRAFSYNPNTNTIMVSSSRPVEDGEMIITWKRQAAAFSSKPLTRKIKLHWDNLADSYTIRFQSNGGSAVPPISQKYGTKITPPANPTRKGYIFEGWYRDAAFTRRYSIPAVMKAENVTVYAKWRARTDVLYTIEYYQQNLENNEYTLAETVKKKGMAGGQVTAELKQYEGFTAPAAKKVTIAGDGSAVVRYEYRRNVYSLTYRTDNGDEDRIYKLKYGQELPVLVGVAKKGSIFGGWSVSGAEEQVKQMPANDLVFTAKWVICDHSGNNNPLTCSKKSVCSVCRLELQAEHKESSWIVDREAACETAGERHKECLECQGLLEKEIVPAAGHSYGSWKILIPAACETDGEKERICQTCQTKETTAIPATGHDQSQDWIVGQEATCLAAGERYKQCLVCRTVLEKESIPILEHQYGEWQVLSPAACEAVGNRERNCQLCLKKETEVVPELGHDYSQEWTIDQESTCTEDGEKSHHCLRCSSRSDITVILKTGHSYPAGSEFCSVCGYRNVTADISWYNESDSEFRLNSEGQLMGLAELVNSGDSFSGKTIILEKDLDLTAIPWIPIGNSSSHFSGIFNGGYHVISNLTIVSGGNTSGLFGEAYNARIEAAGVSGVSITAEESKELGGLIGRDNGGTEVRECFVTGSITGGGSIGGIVGSTHGSSNPTRITNCYTRMTLHGTGTTLDVSGISGWNDSNSILIVNSYTASIGEKRPIAGWSDGAAVNEALVISSWYDKTLSSTSQGLVNLGKTTEELKQKETYGSWDFDSTWSIEAGVNQGYPVLKKYMIK